MMIKRMIDLAKKESKVDLVSAGAVHQTDDDYCFDDDDDDNDGDEDHDDRFGKERKQGGLGER